MMRSRIDTVISSFISAELISKGFLFLPMSLRKERSGWKSVEKALILQVCVETSERVIGRGAKSGYLQGSSMMYMSDSLRLTCSLISETPRVFLRTSEKMFESCNPTIPKTSSYTDPGRYLQSYLAKVNLSSLCLPFFQRKSVWVLRDGCSWRSGVSKASLSLMGLLFSSQSWRVLEEWLQLSLNCFWSVTVRSRIVNQTLIQLLFEYYSRLHHSQILSSLTYASKFTQSNPPCGMKQVSLQYSLLMRFEFCGNLSCPEWFIAEISVLTKITAVKMRLIFSQLVTYYLESADVSSKTVKLLTGTGLDQYEMNAVAATLYFILSNSVMFQVADTILNKELVDLGLPKENVESITKVFKANREKLIEVSLQRGFSISKEIEIAYSIHEFVGSSSLTSKRGTRFAECELTYRNDQEERDKANFIICQQQLDDLIFQLTDALVIMKRLQSKAGSSE